MSKESEEWLNQNILVGYTAKRGNAWHYRESAQGDEPNHYENAVPLADVRRRLFSWEIVERPLYLAIPASIEEMTNLDANGEPAKWMAIPDRKATTRSDTNAVLGIFKDGYKTHQYDEWLLENVEVILGGGLDIGSAGLLMGGGVAFVQIEKAENMVTPSGVEFRPSLLAVGSCNGTQQSNYVDAITETVCDNTMAANLAVDVTKIKFKHTKYSKFDADKVRDALGIIEESAARFTESVERLTNWEITDTEWRNFLDEICKVNPDSKTTRSETITTKKRDDLMNLWLNDVRVTPWKNTAFGVVQATNTWAHHIQTVRGAQRAERNMMSAISGATGSADSDTIKTLQLVTSR